MQIPTSAGMLANSVLPVTPTQGALLSQVGETAGSTSFPPIEAVSSTRLSREVPEQHVQPNFAPENSGRADIAPISTNPAGDSNSEDAKASAHVRPDQDKDKETSDPRQGDSAQDSRRQEEASRQEQQQDLDIIRQLSLRENEVHAHEQAHSSVGGQYAGSAQYSYQRGPDGVNYAVGGEVSIDVGVISGDPRATLEKMQIVQRAALAPADPSSQDRRVAALASQQANQARAEIVSESRVSNGNTGSDDKDDSRVRNELASEKSNIKISAQSSAESESFQMFNDRIAKINEILLAISQSDISNASGQLLDDVI